MIRGYQQDCVTANVENLKSYVSILNVLATGLGKTYIAAEFIKLVQPARCLFFAHRDTLIFQARDTIEAVAGVKCGIEMAELKADPGLFSSDQVIISTVQTQNAGNQGLGRMMLFRPEDFDYLFLDEAHHWVAPSFKKVVDYYRRNLRLKIIGFTATPDRTDREALGQIFQSTAYQYDIEDGINDGWLVSPDQQFVPVHGLDYSHITTTAGDLNLGQLSAVMEEEETVQRMIQPTLEAAWSLPVRMLDYFPVEEWGHILGKRGKPLCTLVFCTSVKQAQRFAEVMNRVRTGMATAIWDKVSKTERRTILDDFKSGALQCLVNVGICGEGFDNPKVEIIAMGRPTKSRSLYTQFIGRGLRPLKGVVDGPMTPELRRAAIASSAKPTVRILDFVGNSGTHKLVSLADILGGKISDRARELAKKKALKSEGPVNISELLEDSEEEVRRRLEKAKRDAESRRVKLVARSNYQVVTVNPFDALDILPAKPKAFDMNKKLSEKQVGLMRRFGINPDKYPYSQAKQLFIELSQRLRKRLATPPQCELLKKHGYEHVAELPYKEAKRLIDNLKNNNWRRPPAVVEGDEAF